MAAKKRKISEVTDMKCDHVRQNTMFKVMFTSADESVEAIEASLEAMDPPIDVYEGILKLIAEFAQLTTEEKLSESVASILGIRDGRKGRRCRTMARYGVRAVRRSPEKKS